MNYYAWFSEALQKEFETQELLKESERSTVSLIRHRASGQPFILRSYTGNAEVYRKLLGYECPNLPKTLEVASDGDKNLVLEEYIQGDNMGILLQDALFTPEETKTIVKQLCRALWVFHSMGSVHRDVNP